MRGPAERAHGRLARAVHLSRKPLALAALVTSFPGVVACSSTRAPSRDPLADAAIGDASPGEDASLADSSLADASADASADAPPAPLDVLGVRWVGRVDPGDASAVRFAWS